MSIRPVQGLTDTIRASDNNNVIAYFANSSVSVTVPAGLPFTFRTTVLQVGTGVVTLAAGSGVTLNSESGSLATDGQNGQVSLTGYSSNEFIVAGNGVGGGSVTRLVAQGGPFLAAGTVTSSGTISNSTASLTAHGIILAEGTAAVAATAALTNGQLLIGATGADPAPQTMSGDGTINAGGTLVVTKVNGLTPVTSTVVTQPWIGINPNNAVIYEFRNAGTVSEVIGNAEILNGAAFTVQLFKASSGTAVASGVTVTSTSFNANTLAFTDQTLTITGTNAVGAIGDRLGIITTGTAGTAMVANLTVKITP